LLVAPSPDPMGTVLRLEPIFCRPLVQKSGDVFDLSAGAMANKLPIPLGNLVGFENNGLVCHLPHILSVRDNHSPPGCHNQSDPLPKDSEKAERALGRRQDRA
jgi:hypothetical protein